METRSKVFFDISIGGEKGLSYVKLSKTNFNVKSVVISVCQIPIKILVYLLQLFSFLIFFKNYYNIKH